MLIGAYPVLFPVACACIIFSAITATMPAIFQQRVLADIGVWYKSGDWAGASSVIIPKIITLASLYVVSLISIIIYTQLMAYISQGFLHKMRCKMFSKMQDLPIRYFDTHKHGDIMSHYTNDIDALRQLIAQAIPSILQASIVIVSVFFIMLYYSVWMTCVVLLGVVAILFVTKKVGSGSAKYLVNPRALFRK